MPVPFAPFVKTIRASHSRNVALWFLWNVVAQLFPTVILLAILALYSKPMEWATFFRQGEFALYAISIMLPVLFSHQRDPASTSGERLTVLAIGGGLCLLGAVVFAAVAAHNTYGANAPLLNVHFLMRSSLILYLVSAACATLVMLVSEVRSRPEPIAAQQESDDALERQFDKLG